MGNITKKDLVEIVSENTGLTQVDTKLSVETLLDVCSDFLISGRNIEIRGFGRFKVKVRKEHKARNPRTGDIVNVAEGRKAVFEASKSLKKKVDKAFTDGLINKSDTSSNSAVDNSPEEPIY